MDLVLELKDISKRYHDRIVLGPLSLGILAGQTTVLVGPSGCGKSTLLRLIMGLTTPDRGEFRLGKQVILPHSSNQLRRRMGYVIQDGGLFPHLTARENITLMARYLRLDPDHIQGRVQELIKLTQYPIDALDRYPVQISGGQRQRVALMRALMLDPQILLLDEPLGALDPMIRYELQTDLKTIFCELNKTVVLVTHDLGEAGYFSDHVVLLREGQIAQQGTLDSLIHHPADHFVERFVTAQRSHLN